MNWDFATDIILYSAIAVLGVFGVLGFSQLITRKSLKKVDKPLLAMLIPLILMAITYIIFDKFLVLNTRPNGSGEASFPSTHVMVVSTIFLLAALNLPRYISSKILRAIIYIIMAILTIATCYGRVAANMHWSSDVIAALIFSCIFAVIYYFIIRKELDNE